MKTLDAQSLHDGIAVTVSEIKTTQSKITDMQKAVRGITSLEKDLKGKTGEAVRTFFNECHQPFLIYMYQFLIHYRQTLEQMGQSVRSFESMESGFIREEFLENNVTQGLDNVWRKATDLTEQANGIMDSVADIVSLSRLDPKELFESVQYGKKKEENVVEQLHALDDYQSSALDEILQDLHTMENYVSDIAGKFKNGSISIADFKVTSIEGLSGYKKMMDSIYHKGGSVSAGPDKNAGGAKKPDAELTAAKEDVSSTGDGESFVSFDPNAPFDSAGDWATLGTESLAFYNTYDATRKGFKVEKYTTKGGITKYRVYKPEAVGIKPSTKKVRKTKLYEKEYLKKEAKRGNHLKITKYVRPGSGAITALKSKAGWLGVGINAVEDAYDNRNKGMTKIVCDLGVDVGVGAVSIAAGGVLAAAAGAFGAPVIVGAAAAFGASVAASYIFDGIKIGKGKNKKSISGHIKSGIQSIAGWFKKGGKK